MCCKTNHVCRVGTQHHNYPVESSAFKPSALCMRMYSMPLVDSDDGLSNTDLYWSSNSTKGIAAQTTSHASSHHS